MSVRPGRGAAPQDTVRDRVYSLPKRFRRESVNGLVAQWELRVGSQTFAISVTDHACMVADGPSPAPETIVTTEPETWLAIDEGRITGGQAFLEKRLVLQGNLDLAVRMQTLFRPYRRARHLSDLDQVEVEADGLRISTYLQGKGDPLLLLHGLGGTKITWFPLLPELAERHRLIVPDLPGHGESEKPREDYTPRFYARVLRHLMDEVGVDKAAVIGNSLGGRITLELALRSPSRVSSLILLDPSVPGLRWRYVFGFTRVFPTELGAVPFMVRERWMRAIIRRLFAHPEVLSDEAFAAGASEFIRIYQDPAARMAFFSSLRHILTEPPEQFFGTLRRIKQPTLVLFGDDDRLVPPRLGVRLAQHLPNSTFMVLPGVGHVPQFEATRETLDAIDGFLASQAPPRRRRSTAP